MEINNLHKYIYVLDDAIPLRVNETFLRFCKDLNYEKAGIVKDKNKNKVEEHIRKTLSYSLVPHFKSMTITHWKNYLHHSFSKLVQMYRRQFNIDDNFEVNDIQILKYVNEGHYNFHTDDSRFIHRRVSCIYLINDDYEGGNLVFRAPDSDKKTVVETKKNRMIIWPSNFLYPHSVETVTKGERYSVVAWAL